MIDTVEFHNIETMTLLDARAAANKIITNSKTKAAKKGRLIRDIEKAWSSAEVSRILWMCALAGEGLGSMDSTWNKG